MAEKKKINQQIIPLFKRKKEIEFQKKQMVTFFESQMQKKKKLAINF